jgi:BirA family biotin operon repressor/biotin-[acetyl-CoA-carboxylase] ligase
VSVARDWFAAELAGAIAPLVAGFRVEIVAEIDSTNTELMRRARDGDAGPVLLVAERQTAGRGRLGRPWSSAQGDGDSGDGGDGEVGGARDASLTFSLGLPLAPRDWSGLSLAVGASVADHLDPGRGAGVGLKWPNDLWTADDRKLGGILIETATLAEPSASAAALPGAAAISAATRAPAPGPVERYVVIGIGLNIAPRDARGLRTPPAWLREWRPGATAPGTLRAIAAPLVRDVLDFAARGFAPFAERFAARDVLRGREVALSDGTEGHCEGVGWGGELRVRTAAGVQSITSSEVSVRPRPATA